MSVAALTGTIRSLIDGDLDHLGIAVPDLDEGLVFHRDLLGLREKEVRRLPDQGLAIAFLQSDNLTIELIAPLPGAVPLRDLLGTHTVQDFLAANPQGGLHHICFRTSNIEEACSVLSAAGIPTLGNGQGAIGASGRRVVFLAPVAPSSVLIELKEAA